MVAAGWFWNTLVLVIRAAALVEAGCHTLPALSDRLASIEPFADSAEEDWAIRQAYESAPGADFSRAVLEASSSILAVSRLPATVSWCDWGTPTRVLRSLRRAKIIPPWLDDAEPLSAAIG
jgi:hypothetical protein